MGTTDWDAMFEALSNRRRRIILVELAARESKNPTLGLPHDVHRGEVSINDLNAKLFHVHLPKLENTGYIAWDREQRSVSRGPSFETIRPVVELIHSQRNALPPGWV